jgi:TolB-like protein/cytochrome c-type biogenesis protein CcmH/NrfG/predicted Ser/Thr protein kinase
MITIARVCRKCGAKISGDGTQRVCPACLLENGLGLSDEKPVAGVVDAGLPQDREKGPRSIRIPSDLGDYELLEEVGRGGQGVVYRAHQKSLNRIVALKVIGQGPWTTERHLKRFRREAEAVAHLEYPYIVPIYEVGERDGQCYFSMKLVDGGQLDEVVRHSPMSIRQAVELVAKVARTVHYAHEHGILHRDIKPGNILLDQNGEPHLTDFGLARLVEGESTVTATLDVLGTPSYMAPEQAAGEHTKVSKATDVYGLGAVLYQLLTGQPPFAGGTTYETIKLLLDTEPRPPSLLNPKIDRDLSTICLKCMEKDPQRRYSSALALAEDLGHWLKHKPISARRTGVFTRGRKWVRRNPTSALLAASLIALAATVGWIVWKTKFIPEKVAAINGVAVLPFENLSGDPDKAYFADGIQEEILTRLAKIADLRVISRASTQNYQSRAKNLSTIAKQLGVANILEGSVQEVADQARVNVQLINAQTNSHLWADTYDRKLTDMLGVESEIAKAIAAALQAKLSGREEQALAARPTNNPEAYDAYLRGMSFDMRNHYTSYSQDLEKKAAASYERAVQLDPKFAFAWARLSYADAQIYNNDNNAARGEAAKHAAELALKLAPNSPETLIPVGSYQTSMLRDFERAKATWERAHKMQPSNSEALSGLGAASRWEGHWDDSFSYYEQALSLDPRNVRILMNTAFTYAIARRFSAALKLYDRVLDITPNDQDVTATKASIYQAQGNLAEAARLLSGIDEHTPNEVTFGKKATQLQLERNYGELTRLLQARLTQFHYSEVEKADYQLWLAFAQVWGGDTAGGRVNAEQACNILQQFYRDHPDYTDTPGEADLGVAIALSEAYALLGEKDLALNVVERVVTRKRRFPLNPVEAPGLKEYVATIQAVVGENTRAISTFTELLQTPYTSFMNGPIPITPASLRLDPTLDPLRSDPRFQKLCQEK